MGCWRVGLGAMMVLTIGSCSPPRAPRAASAVEPAAPTATIASTTPAIEPTITASPGTPAELLLRAVPDALRIDGVLDEWIGEDAAGAPWVAMAVGGDQLVIAAMLPADERAVLHVADEEIGMPLSLGWRHPADGTFLALDEASCERAVVEDYGNGPQWLLGEARPEAQAEACLALLDRHRQRLRTLEGAFRRSFLLSAESVTPLRAGASIAPSALRRGPRGVEATFPLDAMPRLRQAPLKHLNVALTTSGEQDEDAADILSLVDLPRPVSFGPRPAVLALYFDEDLWPRAGSRRLSYHPGAPDRVVVLRGTEGARPDVPSELGLSVTALEEGHLPLLSRPPRPMGSGLSLSAVSDGLDDYLVILKEGRLASHHPETGLVVEGELERGGRMHVFAFDPGAPSWHAQGGYDRAARWLVFAVTPDGQLEIVSDDTPRAAWEAFANEPFFETDFSRFGLEGTVDGKSRRVEWSWNAPSGRYQSRLGP